MCSVRGAVYILGEGKPFPPEIWAGPSPSINCFKSNTIIMRFKRMVRESEVRESPIPKPNQPCTIYQSGEMREEKNEGSK